MEDGQRQEIVKAGIFGTVVGDALGVPVEFQSRRDLETEPVTDMREFGTHHQPRGTWSDDSSMMLACMDSMIAERGFQPKSCMEGFMNWCYHAQYTPHGKVFDIGNTCLDAIQKFRSGVEPLMCGGIKERDNGNGSLMRIMPVALYAALREDYWNSDTLEKMALLLHDASRLTHGHPRSQMACVLYASLCHELIWNRESGIAQCVGNAVTKTLAFYDSSAEKEWFDEDYETEIKKDSYGRMRNLEFFQKLERESIQSTGYVVHTLEAAIWCLLNSASFRECTLMAVNLGDDTDTVGAVAGGLAGLAYGFGNIPAEWYDVIVKKEWIGEMCDAFAAIL